MEAECQEAKLKLKSVEEELADSQANLMAESQVSAKNRTTGRLDVANVCAIFRQYDSRRKLERAEASEAQNRREHAKLQVKQRELTNLKRKPPSARPPNWRLRTFVHRPSYRLGYSTPFILVFMCSRKSRQI